MMMMMMMMMMHVSVFIQPLCRSLFVSINDDDDDEVTGTSIV